MNHHVAHRAHLRPWYLRVLINELGGDAVNLVHGLADNLDVVDYGILYLLVFWNASKSCDG